MGKVLFIESRTGGDFTMDALWAGLVDKFGPTNVIDYPAKTKHREGIPQITGDVEKDYGAERRSLCYTPNHSELQTLNLSQINTLLRSGEIDLIFVDERHETFELYAMTIAKALQTHVVVVAGHDRFWNSSIQNLFVSYGASLKALFLDNWKSEYDQIPNAYPMSYSTNFDHLWEVNRRREFLSNKVYDICFLGYNSHSDRLVVVDHIKKKYGHLNNLLLMEERPNVMDSFLKKSEYFQKMAQSKVCVNLRGGAECGKALRFYEIPYVGSYMLSQQDSAKQVKPFVDGLHCDYFSSFNEFDMFVEEALRDEKTREVVAEFGHEHALKNHTARARVDYIFECLNGQSRTL